MNLSLGRYKSTFGTECGKTTTIPLKAVINRRGRRRISSTWRACQCQSSILDLTMYICTHTYICVYIYTHTRVHKYVHLYIGEHARFCMYSYLMYAYMYAYMHIYAYNTYICSKNGKPQHECFYMMVWHGRIECMTHILLAFLQLQGGTRSKQAAGRRRTI
jgi:hypothetical protein